MKARLSECDLTGIEEEDRNIVERSLEDDEAIAKAVGEVEKEMGPQSSGGGGFMIVASLAAVAAAAWVIMNRR